MPAAWIERAGNRRRRQHGLGRLTPIEYETIMTTVQATPPNQSCHDSCGRLIVEARLSGTVDRMAQLVGPVAAAADDEQIDEHTEGVWR